jgi:putative restriction endonuclease
MNIAAFAKKLGRLRIDRSKGAPAPHKAVLLLSVVQSIEYGEVTDNRVYITAELVARFKDNWHAYVRDNSFTPNFSLPFYHLKSDGFWHLRTLPGRELLLTSSHSIRSFRALKDAVAYAYFDEGVYALLQDQGNRDIIKQTLLIAYLNGAPMQEQRYDLFHEVEAKILNEPAVAYRREVAASDEEELFVRSGVFKKVVPKIYNYSCCISGMKIAATREVQMIDACHIVPFAESHDDTISNGLSLSPNLHRAFDRFLITLGDDYKVIVSDSFTESGSHGIRTFHGQRILLPREERYYPSAENVRWHRERFERMHG